MLIFVLPYVELNAEIMKAAEEEKKNKLNLAASAAAAVEAASGLRSAGRSGYIPTKLYIHLIVALGPSGAAADAYLNAGAAGVLAVSKMTTSERFGKSVYIISNTSNNFYILLCSCWCLSGTRLADISFSFPLVCLLGWCAAAASA